MKISISKRVNNNIYFDRGLTDIVKLLCCLLVAASHYAQHCIVVNNHEGFLLKLLAAQGGYLGVAIFFFLSGYGVMNSLTRKSISFVDFAKKRLSKVYIPAVSISVFWIFLLCLFPDIHQTELGLSEPISWSNILGSLINVFLFKFADSVLWFIAVIMLLYIVVFVYAKLKATRFSHYRWLVLLFLTLAVTVFTYYTVAPFASVSVFAFSFGVVLCDYNSQISSHATLFCIIVFCAISFLFLKGRHDMVIIHGLVNYIVILFWVYLSSKYNIQLLNVPPIIAALSYDIYLIHKKVLVVLFTLQPSASMVIFFTFVIVVSLIVNRIRKININGWSK